MDSSRMIEEDESGNACIEESGDGNSVREEQGDNELIEVNQEHDEHEEQDEQGKGDEDWRRTLTTLPAHAPIHSNTTTFSSREPTLVSVDVEMEVPTEETSSPSNTTTTTTPNRRSDSTAAGGDGKSSSVATPAGSSDDRPSSNSSEESSLPSHHKRFLELQAFLRLCDEADQKELLEALRSLSAAARSGHAFNLEYRALMLSMEEGREMLRLKMLDVMGGKGSPSQSQQENGSTPLGTRLPAPGTATDLSAC